MFFRKWFALRFFTMSPLEHMWQVCRNGRRCVYDVRCCLEWSLKDSVCRVCPSALSSSAMAEDCTLQVRTGADPPRPRRRPSGDERAARTCPCPCRTTLLGAQACKSKSDERKFSVCASCSTPFSDPFEWWIATYTLAHTPKPWLKRAWRICFEALTNSG